MISNDRTSSWLSKWWTWSQWDTHPWLYSSDRRSGLSTAISADRRLHVSLCYQNLWLEKKSNVGQLHTAQKECSTAEISSRSLQQRSKFIQSTHLFCKNKTIDFFSPTEHKGKEMPFQFIRRVYFLIEGQTEIQLSTWTIVRLPSTIHTANQSFCSQVSRCLAGSTA